MWKATGRRTTGAGIAYGNDVDDVHTGRSHPSTTGRHGAMFGRVKVREWFRTYKIPDGKPLNKFASGVTVHAAYACAHGVIRDTHAAYRHLLASGGRRGLHLPGDNLDRLGVHTGRRIRRPWRNDVDDVERLLPTCRSQIGGFPRKIPGRRVRAAEHAPGDPFRVFERRHGLAETVARSAARWHDATFSWIRDRAGDMYIYPFPCHHRRMR